MPIGRDASRLICSASRLICDAILIETRSIASGPKTKNLASIVRGFKSAVTIQARKQDHNFQWQARYHDHIIRTKTALQHISNYIEQNPVNWYKDSLM